MAAIVVNADVLVACVRPWYEPLRQLGSLQPLDESRIAWIHAVHGQREANRERFLEGITLLALLGRADCTLYGRVLEEIWPGVLTSQAISFNYAGLRSVGIKWDTQGDFYGLRILGTFASAKHRQTRAFRDAVALMQAYIDEEEDDEGSDEDRIIRVAVSVMADLECVDSVDLTNALKFMLQMFRTLPLLHAAGGVEFNIVGLENAMPPSPRLDLEGLEYVVKMVLLGISIDSLAELHPDCASPDNVEKLTNALRTIAAVSPDTPGRVKAFVASDDSPVPLLVALISSLHENQTAESFYLRLTNEPPRNPRPVHEDFDALMFNWQGPRAYHPRSEDRFLWWLIATSLFGIHAQHRLQTLHLTLPVLGEGPLNEVRAALEEDQGDLSLTYNSPLRSVDHPGIPEIVIQLMSDESGDSVKALALILGHKIRKLVVKQYEGRQPLDNWCKDVLQGCTTLEELRIYDGGFDSLRVFTDSAATGSSRLQRLSIRNVNPLTDFEGVEFFFQTLGDWNHPLTKHLRELDVGFWMIGPAVEGFATILLEMLKNNRSLQKVSFTFDVDESFQDHRSRFETAFSHCLADDVAVARGPLDPRCKVSFLGALHSRHSSAMATMDNAIIASVFEFAAPTVMRDIHLQFDVLPGLTTVGDGNAD